MSQLTSVMGLPKLLRAVASRLENGSEDLNRALLEQVADRLERLEAVAIVATHIIGLIPYHADHSRTSKVPRATLVRLADALNQMEDMRVKRPRERKQAV